MNTERISIKNFKIFQNKTDFKLRPVTILTGPNNSGKSSFIKFLLLFSKGIYSLDFDLKMNNLLDYNSSLNWHSNSNEMEFEIEDSDNLLKTIYNKEGVIKSLEVYEKKPLNRIYSMSRTLIKKNTLDKSSKEAEKFETLIHQEINFNSYHKHILENFDIIEEFLDLNTFDNIDSQREICKKGLLFRIKEEGVDVTLNYVDELREIQQNYFQDYELVMPERFATSSFDSFIEYLRYHFIFWLNEERMAEFVSNSIPELGKKTFKLEKSVLYTVMLNGYNQITNPADVMLYGSEKLLNAISASWNGEFSQKKGFIFSIVLSADKLMFSKDRTHYLSANRGSQDRVMMNYSEKEFNSILVEFSKRKKIHHGFIQKCLKIMDIEGVLEVNRYENTISTFYLVQNDKRVALADLGFGYSQVIPIILKAHNLIQEDIEITEELEEIEELLNYTSLLILEEPEANLHPNLQSKLAELLIFIKNECKIEFVVETHSEYFIRKLQYLTAKGLLSKDDSIIYYFNDDKYVSKTEPKVKEILINEDGGLSDSFGPGFFDEATKLQFDLIKLNKN